MTGDVKPNQFARMIAKIAHSFAMAEFRSELLYAVLPDVIHNRVRYRDWIGSELMPEEMPTNTGFHSIGYSWTLRDKMAWPIISIQLFAPYRTPIYHALVGPIPLSLLDKKLDQKPMD